MTHDQWVGTLKKSAELGDWQWEVYLTGDQLELVHDGHHSKYFFRMEIGINQDTGNFVVVGYTETFGGYENPPDTDEWYPENEFASVHDAIAFAVKSDHDFFNGQE